MNVFGKGLVTVLSVDALFVLASIPLVLRRVPPNVVYGYRTPATLRDEALWYEANAHFGARFIAAAIGSALVAWWISGSGILAPDLYVPATVVLLGAPVAVAGILTSRFVARAGG